MNLAGALDLHPNTVRSHASALERDGLIHQESRRATAAGRAWGRRLSAELSAWGPVSGSGGAARR